MLLALVVCIVTENVKNMKLNLEVNLIFVKGSNHYDSISGMQDNDHVTYIWQPSSRGMLETCSEYVVRGKKLIQNQIKSQKIRIKA